MNSTEKINMLLGNLTIFVSFYFLSSSITSLRGVGRLLKKKRFRAMKEFAQS